MLILIKSSFYDILKDGLTYTPKHVVIIGIISIKSKNVAST